ncbi:Formylglycine-generating sulfatase enzyme [Planctomycetes bacterium MalM25]|nr:Formylglycine-generating sulfatase enzyme [Planctomycetes bacterium MalM25]
MIRTLIPSLLLAALAALPAAAETVSFDFAPVGNAGNAADPQTGFGAVSYNYAISKTEVTNAQYAAFLNAVDPLGSDEFGLYNNVDMQGNFGGITLTGDIRVGPYVAKPGREGNPVTFVSFFDAMRFTNWLHNGQGDGDTETGAYTIGNGLDEVRSPGARYWIPSENEWYKAAYHDASAGTAGVYFDYATGSDSVPRSDQPSDDPSAVNYFNNDGVANGFNDGYAVSGSTGFPSGTNPLTDVGAYTDATSPYGTFDQNGNVFEWNEGDGGSSFRGSRGGSWNALAATLRPDSWNEIVVPLAESRGLGFRVATIPEPSTLLMGALAVLGSLMRRRV